MDCTDQRTPQQIARAAYKREWARQNRASREASCARYRAANADKINAHSRAKYHEDIEASRAYGRQKYAKDIEASRAASRRKYAENPAPRLAAIKRWHDENPDRRRAITAKRRAARLERTAGWDAELTDLVSVEAADLALRREAATGFPWEVDHVIPLQGRKVSGLHVWNNLAVIPKVENRRKSNKFD